MASVLLCDTCLCLIFSVRCADTPFRLFELNWWAFEQVYALVFTSCHFDDFGF